VRFWTVLPAWKPLFRSNEFLLKWLDRNLTKVNQFSSKFWNKIGFKNLTSSILILDPVFPEGVKNKYEILSDNKERLYFAAETLEENDSFPLKVREIDFTVLGPQGGLVFHLAGTTEVRIELIVSLNSN